MEGQGAAVDKRLERAVLAAGTLLLAIAALTHSIDHDEGQYVAAVALMRSGLPYLDFAYLQTPLQPLALAPLGLLPAGWLLVALRAANVLFVAVAAAALMHALRGRAPAWAAAVGIAAFLAADAVLFAGAVARNDALPLALLAGGIAILLPRADGVIGWRPAALAFLLLGLAVSAKISMALPAAGAGLFVLLRLPGIGRGALAGALVGGLTGLLPSLALLAADPARFWFGVFTYNLEAPQQFWSSAGEGDSLLAPRKMLDLARFAIKGAIPVALLAALLDRRRTADRLLLDLMILGGLVAAYLPDPAFRQYLVPLTAPLFARLALALDSLGPRSRQAMLAATALLALAGLGRSASDFAAAVRDGPELVSAWRDGRTIAAAAGGRRVVILSPERAAGSDVDLDPGFAAGPFLFRTQGALADRSSRLAGSPSWQRLERLDARPPALIVTGGERAPRPPLHPNGLDHHLDLWARSHGYRPSDVRLASAGFRIWERSQHLPARANATSSE